MKKTFCHTSSRPLSNRGGGGGGIFCALSTVVIVTAILAVSCVRPEEDEGKPNPEAVRLSSLTVKHKDGQQTETSLIGEDEFQTDKRNYDIDLDALNISDGVITIEGAAAEEGVALVFEPESVTLPIYNATTITVYHEDDMETPAYTVNIMPPQDNDPNNYDLLSLSLHFSVDGANLIQDFRGSSQNYSINLEKNAPSSIFVDAKASSKAARVKIADGQTALSDYRTSENSAVVAVPTSDSKVITVSVQKQTADAAGGVAYKNYNITLNAYAPARTTYTGTIQGVNAPYTITGLIAREAGSTSGQSARLDTTNPSQWSLTVNSDWTPHSFIVELQDSSRVSYKSALIVPQSVVEQGTVLTVDKVGKVIASVSDLKSIGANSTNSYVLGQNLDLKDVTDWSTYSPSGFSGKFLGNGHTIDNLVLNKGSGMVGFFSSLGINAYLENFTVKVSSSEDLVVDDPGLYFGGIVGHSGASNVNIKGVKVEGKLSFGNVKDRKLLVGGFFGEVNQGSITMENCVSEVDISVNSTYVLSASLFFGIGGFVGKSMENSSGSCTIKNCYSTGNIDIVYNSNEPCFAGGFAGILHRGTNKLINCYATGYVSVKNNATTLTTGYGNGTLAAGGLVGYISDEGASHILQNCAALGSKAIAYYGTAAAPSNYGTGRLVGLDKKNTVFDETKPNFALRGMKIGKDGTPDNSDRGVDATKGAVTAGIAKTAAEFKQAATWQALSFDPSVWDYSTIASDGRPALKN